MEDNRKALFDEQYRVVALENQRLFVRGISTGELLIIHADPEIPLAPEDFPLGKLIALSDPSAAVAN
jgi:hypothetical protein